MISQVGFWTQTPLRTWYSWTSQEGFKTNEHNKPKSRGPKGSKDGGRGDITSWQPLQLQSISKKKFWVTDGVGGDGGRSIGGLSSSPTSTCRARVVWWEADGG